MPEQTNTTTATATAEPTLAEQRTATIAAHTEASTQLAKAQEAERSAPKPSAARQIAKAKRLSWGAKKANRAREIREIELDMRLAGIKHTAWVQPKPQVSKGKTRQVQSQEAIESALKALRGLKALDESDKARIASRVKRLLDEATLAGYTVR